VAAQTEIRKMLNRNKDWAWLLLSDSRQQTNETSKAPAGATQETKKEHALGNSVAARMSRVGILVRGPPIKARQKFSDGKTPRSGSACAEHGAS
jgi:hypothetical protein